MNYRDQEWWKHRYVMYYVGESYLGPVCVKPGGPGANVGVLDVACAANRDNRRLGNALEMVLTNYCVLR